MNGYQLLEHLGGPRFWLAPMVDASDLPLRLLVRKYGTDGCFSPMLHARHYIESEKYRNRNLETCDGDNPLIVQFCGNDADTVLKAAKMVEHRCQAIDLNLGCPQNIAKRGHYGSFLQDEWDLISSIVSTLHLHCEVPVTAKIRIFPEVAKTMQYVDMLQTAGAQIITVHGRIREQRGVKQGLADWNQVKTVKEAAKVPIISNGNIRCLADAEECLKFTGADGIMSGAGLLWNPALFSPDPYPSSLKLSREYLDLCTGTNTSPAIARGHLFKMMHDRLAECPEFRPQLAQAPAIADMYRIVDEIASKTSGGLEGAPAQWPIPVKLGDHSGDGKEARGEKRDTEGVESERKRQNIGLE